MADISVTSPATATITLGPDIPTPVVERTALAVSPSVPEPPARSARPRRTARAFRTVLMGVPVPVLLLALWHLGVTRSWQLPFDIKMQYLPVPGDVAVRLWDLAFGGSINDAFSGELWTHFWASTKRVMNGFVLASVCAVPLGVAMGRSRVVFAALEPTLNLVRPIPVTAWAPLSLLIIGFGDRSTVFLVFLAAFFPVLLNTVTAVRQVPVRLVEAAEMLGAGRFTKLAKVVVPASAPGIVGGLRIGLGLSWVILVVGETVGISVGLGSMITQARDASKTDLIVAGMVVIGAAGFLADRLMVGGLKATLRGRPLIK